MSTAAAVFSRSIIISTPQLVKPCTTQRIFRTRLQFYPGITCFKDKKLMRPNSMTQPSTIIRADYGDEGVKAVEREAFLDKSQKFFEHNELETTLNNSSIWLVTILFGIFLVLRHDAEALWGAFGSVINGGMSAILKRLLNHERPVSNLRSDPGMPSSHAQSISYITSFAILSVVQWWGLNGFTAATSGTFLGLSSYFIWLRVTQQFHTISQVVVGALLGTIFPILWFWSWDSMVQKAFVSNLWVRIVIILGAAAFCIGLILYVIRCWFTELLRLHFLISHSSPEI